LLREANGDGFADAGAGTGDDSNFSLQVGHRVLLANG
jgi:hypothetical protein